MRAAYAAAGIGVLLAAAALRPAGIDRERAAMGRLQRLAGPLGSAAASVQWMRFTLTLRTDAPRALAIGRSALAMDPLSPEGWRLLAHHLIFERGSAVESGQARRPWIVAGLDLLEEGACVSREPGTLLYDMGLVATYFASLEDGQLPWPGARRELVERALEGFAGAAAAGHRRGPEALADARQAAAALGIDWEPPSSR